MSDTQAIDAPTQTDQPRCDACGAAVESTQRYCVNCGNHRRHVPDPAARYLAARAASSPATAPGRLGRRAAAPELGVGLLGGLALALIPVAAAVGVAVGRASNDDSAQLARAVAQEQARVQTTTVTAAAGAAGESPAAARRTRSTTTTASSRRSHKATRTSTTPAAAAGNGPATKVTATKVTKAAQAQGAAEAKKVQNSTGKNYVNSASSLPSTIVVGP